jgi:DNA helicase-2/ATP-dependent DNA helicase PcrA
MEEYESLRSFLEHVALVMDAEQNERSTPSRS